MGSSVFQRVDLTPSEVTAGDSVEFVIEMVVGDGYTEGQSRIILDLPATVSMSRPTIMHQEESGYAVAFINNPRVTYSLRVWDMEILDFPTRTRTSWRGMAARMIVLDLGAGLAAGDTLRVVWGATAGGYSGGAKVTHVVPKPNYRANVHVRYFESQQEGLPDLGRSFEGYRRPEPVDETLLSFGIKPRAVHHLRLIRRQDHALLIPHDLFWNVGENAGIGSLVDSDEPPTVNPFGVYRFESPAVHVRSKGLPLTATAEMRDVYEGYNIYWGDIHTHSAFSNDCIEREKLRMSPGDLMDFARYRAGLDFYATTDHHQPWDEQRNRIGRAAWEATLAAVDEHNEDNRFVVFPGIEYRCPRGDTAVVFGWNPSYDEVDRPEWTDVRELWKGLQGRPYLSIPHFHNPGGLGEGEWWENRGSGVEPVLEMFSCHGSYEREDALEHHIPLSKASRPDRYGIAMLERGLRYGFVANSDSHKGHVGLNGVTAVFARVLTREAIIEAYRERRVYGTTNARLRLVFCANGRLMGSTVANSPRKRIMIDVTGESPLKKVELFRGPARHTLYVPDGGAHTFRTEVNIDDPAGGYWYVRATQLDNHIAWSSPVWFE